MTINKIAKLMSAVCTIGIGIAEVIIGAGKLKNEVCNKTEEETTDVSGEES